MNDEDTIKEFAEHQPSEGENLEHVLKHSSRQGIEQDVASPEGKAAAEAAPDQADPDAASRNREFVHDTAMRYNDAEEEFSKHADDGSTSH